MNNETLMEAGFNKIIINTDNPKIEPIKANKPCIMYVYYTEEFGVLYSLKYAKIKDNNLIIEKPFIKKTLEELILRQETITIEYSESLENNFIINDINKIYIEFIPYEMWANINIQKATKIFNRLRIDTLLSINKSSNL